MQYNIDDCDTIEMRITSCMRRCKIKTIVK